MDANAIVRTGSAESRIRNGSLDELKRNISGISNVRNVLFFGNGGRTLERFRYAVDLNCWKIGISAADPYSLRCNIKKFKIRNLNTETNKFFC